MPRTVAGAGAPLLIIVGLCAPLLAPGVVRAQVGVNVFGLSYHDYDDPSDPPDGLNPGLGLHWTFDRGRRSALEANAGVYRDSYRHANSHASLGARVRVAGPLELGLQATLTRSASVNDDDPYVYPIPFVALRWRRAVLNAYYLPEMKALSGIETLGFGATVFPFAGGFAWDDPAQRHADRRSRLEFRLAGLNGLRAYDDLGIAWRRSLGGGRWLRLGYGLSGTITRFERGDASSDASRFANTLFVQHLWRHRPGARLGSYTAAGARVNYADNGGWSTFSAGAVVHLGVEYALTPTLGLCAEYGLFGGAVREKWFYGPVVETSDYFRLAETHVTLGITAGL